MHRRSDLLPWLKSMQDKFAFAEFFPMSAYSTSDIERLLGVLEPYLPEQPWFYDAEMLTDRSERFLVSEVIREKLFRLTGDELPYNVTVVIDQFAEEGTMRRIAATIIVERDAHKGMVIGAKGQQLKRIASESRQELERLLEAKVFLEVWVKVRSRLGRLRRAPAFLRLRVSPWQWPPPASPRRSTPTCSIATTGARPA